MIAEDVVQSLIFGNFCKLHILVRKFPYRDIFCYPAVFIIIIIIIIIIINKK